MLGQEVVINEFLASNAEVNTDPDFSAWSDWIELYNPGVDAIDLGGYFMTDNRDNPDKWEFPLEAEIAPGDYLLIWADGRDTVIDAIHANFRLSSEGEEIAVFNPDLFLLIRLLMGPKGKTYPWADSPTAASIGSVLIAFIRKDQFRWCIIKNKRTRILTPCRILHHEPGTGNFH